VAPVQQCTYQGRQHCGSVEMASATVEMHDSTTSITVATDTMDNDGTSKKNWQQHNQAVSKLGLMALASWHSGEVVNNSLDDSNNINNGSDGNHET